MNFLKPYLVYLKIGGVAAVLALIGVLYFQRASLRNKVDDLTRQRDAVVEANKAQAVAMARVVEQREQDAKAIARLIDDVQAVEAKNKKARAQIITLERSDASVRAYLNGAVPDAVGSVLADEGGSEDRGGDAAPARRTAPSVHAADGR